MSLENLKLDADALGIAYRADIKAESLQKKIDKHTNVQRLPVEENPYKLYVNRTKNNIFTESGRCSPNKRVTLKPEDAEKYSGLELWEA